MSLAVFSRGFGLLFDGMLLSLASPLGFFGVFVGISLLGYGGYMVLKSLGAWANKAPERP